MNHPLSDPGSEQTHRRWDDTGASVADYQPDGHEIKYMVMKRE